MHIMQLRCFIILCETLNFSHTAEILNLTQPAITHQIKKLESLLRFSLFTRSKHGVELTTAGKVFYPDARDILARLQTAISKAASIDKELTSVISIGYEGHDLEKRNLPMMINRFKAQNKPISVMVFQANHNERRNRLLTGRYDLIMTAKDNIENIDGVIYKQIVAAGLHCMVGEGHALSRRTAVTVDDLSGETLIFLDPLKVSKTLNIVRERLTRRLSGCRFIHTDFESSAAIMAASGEGVAILPMFCHRQEGGLVQIPLTRDENISYGVAYLKNNNNEQVPGLARTIQESFRLAG